ncbi:hypothetical protein DIPPA_24517 [Diplonema papillatum]|nr:hypothetical protein DIPPA_24517 [Diplonema papillatum]
MLRFSIAVLCSHLLASAAAVECGEQVDKDACSGQTGCVWYKEAGPCTEEKYETCPELDVVFLIDVRVSFNASFGAYASGYDAFLGMLHAWAVAAPVVDGGLRVGLVPFRGSTATEATTPITANRTEFADAVAARRAAGVGQWRGNDVDVDSVQKDIAALFAAVDSPGNRKVVVTFAAGDFSSSGLRETYTATPDVTSLGVGIWDEKNDAGKDGLWGSLAPLATFPPANHVTVLTLDEVPDLFAGMCAATEFLGKQLNAPPEPESGCPGLLDEQACGGGDGCVWIGGEGLCTEKKFEHCPVVDVVVLFSQCTGFIDAIGKHPVGYVALLEMLSDWIAGMPTATAGKPGDPLTRGIRVGLLEFPFVAGSLVQPITGDQAAWRSTLQQHAMLFKSRGPHKLNLDDAFGEARGMFAAARATDPGRRAVVLVFSAASVLYDDNNEAAKLVAENVTTFTFPIEDAFNGDPLTLHPFTSMPTAQHNVPVGIDSIPELLGGICDETSFLGSALSAPRQFGGACAQIADRQACGDWAGEECVWYNGTGPCAAKKYAECPPGADVVVMYTSSDRMAGFGGKDIGYPTFYEMLREWLDGMPLAGTDAAGNVVSDGLRVGLIRYGYYNIKTTPMRADFESLAADLQADQLRFEPILSTNIQFSSALDALEQLFEDAEETGPGRRKVVVVVAMEGVTNYGTSAVQVLASAGVTSLVLAVDDDPASRYGATLTPLASFPSKDHWTSTPAADLPRLLAGLCDEAEFLGRAILSPAAEPGGECTRVADAAACEAAGGCGWHEGAGACVAAGFAGCPAMDVVVVFDSTKGFSLGFGAHPMGYTAFLGMLGDWIADLPMPKADASGKLVTEGVRVGIVQFWESAHQPGSKTTELRSDRGQLFLDLQWHALVYNKLPTATLLDDALKNVGKMLAAGTGTGPAQRKIVILFSAGAVPPADNLGPAAVVLASAGEMTFSIAITGQFAGGAEEGLRPLGSLPHANFYTAAPLDAVPELLAGLCNASSFMGKQVLAREWGDDCARTAKDEAACQGLPGCAWYRGVGPCTHEAYADHPGMDVVVLIDASDVLEAPFGDYDAGYPVLIDAIRQWVDTLPLAADGGDAGFRVGFVQFFGNSYFPTPISGDAAQLFRDLHLHELEFAASTESRSEPVAAFEHASGMLAKASSAGCVARAKMIVSFFVNSAAADDFGRVDGVVKDPAVRAKCVVLEDGGSVGSHAGFYPFASDPAEDNFAPVRLSAVVSLLANASQAAAPAPAATAAPATASPPTVAPAPPTSHPTLAPNTTHAPVTTAPQTNAPPTGAPDTAAPAGIPSDSPANATGCQREEDDGIVTIVITAAVSAAAALLVSGIVFWAVLKQHASGAPQAYPIPTNRHELLNEMHLVNLESSDTIRTN